MQPAKLSEMDATTRTRIEKNINFWHGDFKIGSYVWLRHSLTTGKGRIEDYKIYTNSNQTTYGRFVVRMLETGDVREEAVEHLMEAKPPKPESVMSEIGAEAFDMGKVLMVVS